MHDEKNIQAFDSWNSLKKFTDARIALGKTGVSIPLKSNLDFKLAHAHARDAVYEKLNHKKLLDTLAYNERVALLRSLAITRSQYLQRPDLGRILNEKSVVILQEDAGNYDICICIADGLSATAVNNHALPLLNLLLNKFRNAGYSIAPVCVIDQARVAISDHAGALLQSKISVILIGERPGLSAPDSLGVYITYKPMPGNTDAMRNCISNIRSQGLSYAEAAEKICYLVQQSLRLKLSGVKLKDQGGFLK